MIFKLTTTKSNCVVQIVKLYIFGKNSLWLNIVHNKQFNSDSLDFTRKLRNINDDTPNKVFCSIYFILTAVKTLVD